MPHYRWKGTVDSVSHTYVCGYCGATTAPNKAYINEPNDSVPVRIYICSACSQPTYVDPKGKQYPAVRLGVDVGGISDAGVKQLYSEARDCTAAGAYTAAVMLCRKLLMNVSVHLGAQPGESFQSYITYLWDQHYVPINSKAWMDHIRKKGNEANHEIHTMTEADAKELLKFTEMLLRLVYEFPSSAPSPPPP